jgi:hypothetical protein
MRWIDPNGHYSFCVRCLCHVFYECACNLKAKLSRVSLQFDVHVCENCKCVLLV